MSGKVTTRLTRKDTVNQVVEIAGVSTANAERIVGLFGNLWSSHRSQFLTVLEEAGAPMGIAKRKSANRSAPRTKKVVAETTEAVAPVEAAAKNPTKKKVSKAVKKDGPKTVATKKAKRSLKKKTESTQA